MSHEDHSHDFRITAGDIWRAFWHAFHNAPTNPEERQEYLEQLGEAMSHMQPDPTETTGKTEEDDFPF